MPRAQGDNAPPRRVNFQSNATIPLLGERAG